MSENELLAWIRLQKVPGIGPVNGRKLLRYFGDAVTLFKQSRKALVGLPGVGPKVAGNLRNVQFQREAEVEYLKMVQKGIRCLALEDKAYPELLRECTDAPLVLFQKGPLDFTGNRFLSIVGTRSMTVYGRKFCGQLLEELTPYNPVIVSGLAYGVDIYAQKTALNMGFRTVSCLGHGLDTIYPGGHAKYVPEILETGALLSEFWTGTPPEPMNFVRRNRIIAGLSPATVVIESGAKGGSLITADLAFGYNREVFAVPGKVTDPFSSGCNDLIHQQKAQLLVSAHQIAESLNWSPGEAARRNIKKTLEISKQDLTPEELRICQFLTSSGVQILDEIALSCALSIQEASACLFKMEMKDIIRPYPGKKFEIVRELTD